MKKYETVIIQICNDGDIYVYNLRTGKDEYKYEYNDISFYEVINDLNQKGYRLICIKNEDTSEDIAYMDREIDIEEGIDIPSKQPSKRKETQFEINGINLTIIEEGDRIIFKPNEKGLEDYSFSFSCSVSHEEFIDKLDRVTIGLKKLIR